MSDPLSITTGILSLLTLALKLVVGAVGMIDKTHAAHQEALDELKTLHRDLEHLQTQVEQVHEKLRMLAESTRDRAFKKLLKELVLEVNGVGRVLTCYLVRAERSQYGTSVGPWKKPPMSSNP
jgi:hypothetical protein